MNRGYSVLNIKSVSEDERTITGIATTPATDLQDDVVEPRGAVFKLPIPLLWQHQHDAPVGWVTAAKVTDAGIEIVAKIATIADPGKLKDRVDEAWGAIRAGLVKGLSIGFKGLDSEPIRGTYGVRYLKWLWLELSAVTLAANVEASILSVKRADFRDGRSTHIEVDLQRAAALSKVDTDIARINRLIDEKQKLLKADQAKHALDQNTDLQKRLGTQLSTLRQQADDAQEKRFKVEIGEIEKPKAPQPARQRRAWEIDEKAVAAGPPEYPAVMRGNDNGDVFQDAYEESKHYWRAALADHFRKADLPADTAVHLDFISNVEGDVYANHLWAMHRCMALEARVAELEANGQRDAYKGVFQRALPYSKGALVTHDGSLWAALQDVQEGTLPGTNPTSWQLAAKGTTNPPKLGKARTHDNAR
ncbi:hypothetical protein FJV76_29315 [Mesorhizobium sp. WSM4303]|uniref:HK97 family phage prohead protease n=1 Tax=unclassified Mesorhizobium TaxID=325217 RepID=UPI00115CE12C|nr:MULTISPECIES: HK97 family phage prohead protease [unclassified Mesorhizobium]TRC92185.1 hypothetical protein FJV77_25900 [Mesorhizobium sp. WSM4306]TRC95573.1 hypothetical protein FJV76_29315 [Mesorhizobium sp. WSM4303]